MNNNYFDIFIPSYHRADNLKTVKYFCKIGWKPEKIHVFIDSEADDKADYETTCAMYHVQLHVFDMNEARARYDYVHRASKSRRSVGQARNMFQDFAKDNGIQFYLVQDDDTESYSVRWHGEKEYRKNNGKPHVAIGENVIRTFFAVREFMERHQIGIFGLSQEGDLCGGPCDMKLLRKKVMNTTFYLMPYIYRGERGVQDEDTSLFAGVMNEGLLCGSFRYGVMLHQCASATAKGGLTDLYNECKLLNKAMVVPIQFPTCARGEKQIMNGGRLHHRINYRYLFPCIMRNAGGRGNIRWDTYKEDTPFTNEPKRKYILK